MPLHDIKMTLRWVPVGRVHRVRWDWEEKIEISKRRGRLIIGDTSQIQPTPTALLPRSFQHPAACEVRALACGESRWFSRCLYKTGAEINAAVGKGASRGRRYRARFISRELVGEEDEWKRGLGLGVGLDWDWDWEDREAGN
jgi:hypothetical protein